MTKTLIAAAAFAALALGSAGSASAAVTGHGLGGVRAHAPAEVAQQVHWRHGWHKHRKHRVCVWRHGERRCWWRR